MHELGNTSDHAARLAQPRPRLVERGGADVHLHRLVRRSHDPRAAHRADQSRAVAQRYADRARARHGVRRLLRSHGFAAGLARGPHVASRPDRSRRGAVVCGDGRMRTRVHVLPAVPGAHRSGRRGGRALPRRDVDHQRFVPEGTPRRADRHIRGRGCLRRRPRAHRRRHGDPSGLESLADSVRDDRPRRARAAAAARDNRRAGTTQ